jgi:hypothetical protein
VADELNDHLGLAIPVGKGVKTKTDAKSVKKKSAGGGSSAKPARGGRGQPPRASSGNVTPRAPITGKGKKLGGSSVAAQKVNPKNAASARAAYFEKLLATQND